MALCNRGVIWLVLLLICPSAQAAVQKYDFQGEAGPVEEGFVRVTPADLYAESEGFGFIGMPEAGVNGSRHAWQVFGRRVRVDDAIPSAVLSDASRDCVIDAGGIEFRADVPPGEYEVIIWLGDVTTPRFQVRATINGVVVDVERMDIGYRRGSFDTAIFGNAVPRQVRISAPDGLIEVSVGPHPEGHNPITWTYVQDEDPKQDPYERTVTLVPAYSAVALQALVIHPAADPPFELSEGMLVPSASGSHDAPILSALGLFNQGWPVLQSISSMVSPRTPLADLPSNFFPA